MTHPSEVMRLANLVGPCVRLGACMREIEEHKQTGNMSLFNKLLKRVRANKGDISCSYCPYNKRENSSYKKDRSWKKHRKSQFRGIR